MVSSPTVFLMYHELARPGQPTVDQSPGYMRYVVPEAAFRSQLQHLHQCGYLGRSVGQSLAEQDLGRPSVVITFDDGCATDLYVAAPMLRQFGFEATFYLVAGFVGRPGFLHKSGVRELADNGFEIGCHSMTHAYLSDLDADGLRCEMVEARDRLEQIIGRRVVHFSCPGGRWSSQIPLIARAGGYSSVATSHVAANTVTSDRYKLARVAIRQNTSLAAFDRVCRARGLRWQRAKDQTLAAVKGILGNAAYDAARSSWLRFR